MTGESESRGLVPLREAIQSQHPGIADEIEGAIQTLRKLKEITGTGAPEPLPAQGSPALFGATEALTAARFSVRDAPGGLTAAPTEAEPHPGAEVPLLAPSTCFGRYQIVRTLGRGAMGAVYLAYDSQLHRQVRWAPCISPTTRNSTATWR
jgi:hypothetical protein